MSKKAIVDFIPVNAPAYTGPGDIVTFSSWWGFRAYNAATVGNNLIQIKRASDNTTQDFASVSTGALDTSSIATFLTSTSGVVTKFYDQVGSITQNYVTTAAPYSATAVGGTKPGAAISATGYTGSPATYVRAAPYAASFVAQRASHTTTFASVLDLNAAVNIQCGFANSSGNVFCYAGAVGTASATEGAVVAVLGIFTGSGTGDYPLFVNGTKTGSLFFSSGAPTTGSVPGFNLQNAGYYNFAEGGWISAAPSDGNVTSLQSNQTSYWI